eukprot:6491164-Amphidinium_carterae.3
MALGILRQSRKSSPAAPLACPAVQPLSVYGAYLRSLVRCCRHLHLRLGDGKVQMEITLREGQIQMVLGHLSEDQISCV